MSFQELPFLDVFKDASAGNIKTPQKEFLEEGEIPVVDQGQSLVAGFVKDRSRISKAKPPVIVFGDHTRAIKYVDFEFAMGADGTKVLVPEDRERHEVSLLRAELDRDPRSRVQPALQVSERKPNPPAAPRRAARLRRSAGLLLSRPARAGAPGQACLQGRQDVEPTEGHELGRLP